MARDPDAPEVFADYDEYANSVVWPAVVDQHTGELKLTHVDEMAPQHASSAIWKLKRWVEGQWATDMDAERAWVQWQRTTLYRALAARASGVDDLSEAFMAAQGFNDSQAVHLVARTLLEGAGDEEDPMEIVKVAQRLVAGLYRRGYVITRKV